MDPQVPSLLTVTRDKRQEEFRRQTYVLQCFTDLDLTVGLHSAWTLLA